MTIVSGFSPNHAARLQAFTNVLAALPQNQAEREKAISRILNVLRRLAVEAGDKEAREKDDLWKNTADEVAKKLPENGKYSRDALQIFSDLDPKTTDDPATVNLKKWAAELYDNKFRLEVQPVEIDGYKTVIDVIKPPKP